MPQSSGPLPDSLRRFRLKTAALRKSFSPADDDSTEFGAHGEELTIAGRLKHRRQLLLEQSQQPNKKSKGGSKQLSDGTAATTAVHHHEVETNSIGAAVRLSQHAGRYSHDYQYNDETLPRTIRQLADLARAEITNTFLPSHIPIDPHQVSSQDFRHALVRELDADVLEVFFSLEFARDRRGREEMFDELETILTRIMKSVYLAGFTSDFQPSAGEDKKWADYVQNRAHYKAVLRHKLKLELLGYQQLAAKKLQVLQEADDWFSGTTKLVDQEDMAEVEQTSRDRYEAAKLMLTDLKEMFDRMVAGLQRAKDYIEEGNKENARFVPVQFEEDFMLKHNLVLPPQSLLPGSSINGEVGSEPPNKKQKSSAGKLNSHDLSAALLEDVNLSLEFDAVEAGATQEQAPDPNLLLPRSNEAKPLDFNVLQNVAAHASDPYYARNAVTTAKLLLYRAFGAQWTLATDRRQFLALGFEQIDALSEGFQDLLRLKQEHQEQFLRQQAESHLGVVERYKSELRKLQDRCKKSEADKYELRQKYELLKKQAGDARLLGAALNAAHEENEQQAAAENARTSAGNKPGERTRPSTNRGPYQQQQHPSSSENEKRANSSFSQQTSRPASAAAVSTATKATSPPSQQPEAGKKHGATKSDKTAAQPLPLPRFTYSDDDEETESSKKTTLKGTFPRRRSADGVPSTVLETSEENLTEKKPRDSPPIKRIKSARSVKIEDDDRPSLKQDDNNELLDDTPFTVESQHSMLSATPAQQQKSATRSLSARGDKTTKSATTIITAAASRRQQLSPSRKPPGINNTTTKTLINQQDQYERKRERHGRQKVLALKALLMARSASHVREIMSAANDSSQPLQKARRKSTTTTSPYRIIVDQLLSFLGRLGEGRPTLRSLRATEQAFDALHLIKQMPADIARPRVLKFNVVQQIVAGLSADRNAANRLANMTAIKRLLEEAKMANAQHEMAKSALINALYGNVRAQVDKINGALGLAAERQQTIDALVQESKLPLATANNFFKCLTAADSRTQLESIMTTNLNHSPSEVARFWHAIESLDLLQTINHVLNANSNKSNKRRMLEINVIFAPTMPEVGALLMDELVKQTNPDEVDQNFGQLLATSLTSHSPDAFISHITLRAVAVSDSLPEMFAILNAENVVLTDPKVEQVFIDTGLTLSTVEEQNDLRLARKKLSQHFQRLENDDSLPTPVPSSEDLLSSEQKEAQIIGLLQHGTQGGVPLSEVEQRVLRISETFGAIACSKNLEDAVGLLHAMAIFPLDSDLKPQLLELLSSAVAEQTEYKSSEIFKLLRAIHVSDSLPQLRAVLGQLQPDINSNSIDEILQRLGVLPAGGGGYSLSNTNDFTREQEDTCAVVSVMKLKRKFSFLRRALGVLAACEDEAEMRAVLERLALSDAQKLLINFERILEYAATPSDDGEEENSSTIKLGTLEALGISVDPADVLSILSYRQQGATLTDDGVLCNIPHDALHLLKLLGINASESRLLAYNSVTNRIAAASATSAAAVATNDNSQLLTSSGETIDCNDIIEMLALATNGDHAVDIVQQLVMNYRDLHVENDSNIDMTRLEQTLQFGSDAALFTCQALSLSLTNNLLTHIVPMLDVLGVDRTSDDVVVMNEVFDALGLSILSSSLLVSNNRNNSPHFSQQQQQQGAPGDIMPATTSAGGRRVSSALLQLNRKRRGDATTAAANANEKAGPEVVVAQRVAQQQQQSKTDVRNNTKTSKPISRSTSSARKQKSENKLSSSTSIVREPAKNKKTKQSNNNILLVDDGFGADRADIDDEIQLDKTFDLEFEAFNENLDAVENNTPDPKNAAATSPTAVLKAATSPSFRITNQVHIMARQKQIDETEWDSLKLQVEDLEHQMFEQTNLEQSNQQQIRWLKQENKTLTTQLETQQQDKKKVSVSPVRLNKTETSQTPQDWWASVLSMAQSTAISDAVVRAVVKTENKQTSPLIFDADDSAMPSAAQSRVDIITQFNASQAPAVAKAKQVINRAKLHAFVEKLKIIHYHATQASTKIKPSLPTLTEEVEPQDDSSHSAATNRPFFPPVSKLEALQIITNALDALENDMVFSVGIVTDADNYRTIQSPPPINDEDNDRKEEGNVVEKTAALEFSTRHGVVEQVLVQLQDELVILVGNARELVAISDPVVVEQSNEKNANVAISTNPDDVQNTAIEAKLEALAEAIDNVATRYEAALEQQHQQQTIITLPNKSKSVKNIGRPTSSSSRPAAYLDEPTVQSVVNLTLNDLNTKLRHIANKLIGARITEEDEEENEQSDNEADSVRTEESKSVPVKPKPTVAQVKPKEEKVLPKSETLSAKKPAEKLIKKQESKQTPQSLPESSKSDSSSKTSLKPSTSRINTSKPLPKSLPSKIKRSPSVLSVRPASKTRSATTTSEDERPTSRLSPVAVQLQRQLIVERQVTNTILQQLNVLSEDASIPQRVSDEQHQQQQAATPMTTTTTTTNQQQLSPSTSSPHTRRQLEQIANMSAALDHFKQEALEQRSQINSPEEQQQLVTFDDNKFVDESASPSTLSEPSTIQAIAGEQRIRANLLSNINRLITASVGGGGERAPIEMLDFTTQVRIASPTKQHSAEPTILLAEHEAVCARLEDRIKAVNSTLQAETAKLLQHHKRLRIFFELKIRDINEKNAKTFATCSIRLQQVVARINQHAEDVMYAVKVHLPEAVSPNVPHTMLQIDPLQLQQEIDMYFPEIYAELDRVMSGTRFMVKAAVHSMDVKLVDVYEEMEGMRGRSSNGKRRTGGGGNNNSTSGPDDEEYQRLLGALQQMDMVLSDEKKNQALEMAENSRKLEQLMRDYTVLEQSAGKAKEQLLQQIEEKQSQVNKMKKECLQMKRIIDGQREKMAQLYDLLDARKREVQRSITLKCADLKRACEQLHFAYEQQAIDLEVYEALRECTQIAMHMPQMQLCRIFERFIKYAYLRTNQQHLADDAVQRNLKLDFATRLNLTATERRVSERNEQLQIDTRRTRDKRDSILSDLSDAYSQLDAVTGQQFLDANHLFVLRKAALRPHNHSATRREKSLNENSGAAGRDIGHLNFTMPNQATIMALINLQNQASLTKRRSSDASGGGDQQQLHATALADLYVRDALARDEEPKPLQLQTTAGTLRLATGASDARESLYVKGLALDVDKTREIIGRRKWTLTNLAAHEQQQFQQQQNSPPFVYDGPTPYGIVYDINRHRIQALRSAAATSRQNSARKTGDKRIIFPLAQSGLAYGDVDVNDVESVEAEGQVKTYVGTNLMRAPFSVPNSVRTYADKFNVRAVVAVPPLDNYDIDPVDDRAVDKREYALRLIEHARHRHALLMQQKQKCFDDGRKMQRRRHSRG